MEYKYRVFESVYNDMLSGKQKTEIRLLNEKSNSIKKGDYIKFMIEDNESKYLLAKVVDKYIFNNIDELYNARNIFSIISKYTKEKLTKELYNIFGEDNVKSSKIVGFIIEVQN